jgi:non-heme chloroperoxidase
VSLETLDWGGLGWSFVLLAGSGNTAHVFDDFAPQLTGFCHVYGITRRGYGASSQPNSGYGNQRLANDVLAVLNTLGLQHPILAGHSMAGGEITILASEHPDRVGGLVYLDALADPRDFPASDPAYMALFRRLPAAIREPLRPSEAESKSFQAYRNWQMRSQGFAFPESELRNIYETNADGSKGKFKTPKWVFDATGTGETKRDYARIRVPVLVFLATESPDGEKQKSQYVPKNPEERAAAEAFNAATAAYVDRWKRNLKNGVPSARIIELPGAGHYVFLPRGNQIARDLREFVSNLDGDQATAPSECRPTYSRSRTRNVREEMKQSDSGSY